MKTEIFNIFNVLENIDPDDASYIAALRGIANTSVARCIGAIRRDLRNQRMQERAEEQISLDDRNTKDEVNKPTAAIDAEPSDTETRQPMHPLREASIYHSVYTHAFYMLNTMSQSPWDQPLNCKTMLEIMMRNTDRVSPEFLTALSEQTGLPESQLYQMDEVQKKQERENLQLDMPHILSTWESFDDSGSESAIDELDFRFQHQIAVKAATALINKRDKNIALAMRQQRLDLMNDNPLLEDAFRKLRERIYEAEKEHSADIHEWMEEGYNIATLPEKVLPEERNNARA